MADPEDLSGPYMERRQTTDASAVIQAARARTQSRQGVTSGAVTAPGQVGADQAPVARPGEPEADSGGILATAGAIAADVGVGLTEIPLQVIGGIRDAGQEVLDASASLLRLAGAEGEGIQLPEVGEGETVTSNVGRNIAQFVTGFLPAMRATKGLAAMGTAGKITQPLVAGAIADATVFDPQEDRLSNLLTESDSPVLNNAVTQFLAAKPGDGEAEGRFKNALEGLALGGVSDAFVHSVRAVRGSRAMQRLANGQDLSPLTLTQQAVEERPLFAPSKETVERAPQLLERLAPGDDAVNALGDGSVQLQGKRRAININLNRIESSEDAKTAIEETAKLYKTEIQAASRGVQSHELTAQLADQMGLTPEQLLKRRQGQAFNAEEALASRRLLVASSESVVQLAQKANAANAGDLDLVKFQKAVETHAALQQQVSGLTAEAGRALQAFRIPAGAGDQQIKAVREILALSGGRKGVRSMARLAEQLGDPGQVAAFTRQASRAKGSDILFEAWINGLLSGPQTHAVNTLSNSIVALWQVPERMMAAGIRSFTGGAGVVSGEATAQAFGLVQGMRDGLRLAGKTLRTGEPTRLSTKLETAKRRAFTGENIRHTLPGRAINRVTGGSLEQGGLAARAADFIGEYVVRAPGRMLTVEDEFFKAVGYRMELNARAWRQGVSEGLEGDDLAKRVQSIINDPPEDIRAAAIDAEEYQTFTKPLGEGGRLLQSGSNKVPGLRLIIPFIRTPVNIMKFVGERTPLAPLSRVIREDIMAGGVRRDMALARMAMGSMVMAVAGDLAASGQIAGGGPTNPAMRSTWRRLGRQPYSIKVGDTWHAFSRLDPLGATLGIAADISAVMGQVGKADVEALAAAGVMAVANNIINKTYMSGIADLMEIFASVSPEAGASRGEQFIKRFAGTLIPTGVAQVARTIDPTLRQTDSIIQQIKSRVPGYSDELPPRRNLWGEPILLEGGLGPDIISPIYTNAVKDTPADEELIRLNLPVSMPTRQIEGVDLTPEEYDLYVRLAGNELKDPATGLGLKDTLNALVDGGHAFSQAYAQATDGPDGGKATVIRRITNSFRDLARAETKRAFPELQEAIRAKQLGVLSTVTAN